MKEVWKKIVGFDKYEVSNLGRVRSLYKYDVNKKEHILRSQPLIMKPSAYKNYEKLRLCNNSSTKKPIKYIHRLVAEAFIDNPNNYKEINHKDSNSRNNIANNLEWCDRKYNINCMIKHQKKIKERNEMRLEILKDIYYGIENGNIKSLNDVKQRIDINLLENY